MSTFGQGTETTFAQMAASLLGLDPSDVAIHRGDSQGTPYSVGGFASRTMIAGAGAIEQHRQAHAGIATGDFGSSSSGEEKCLDTL